ncbi:MAG: PPK2 family polyphosphate kinase [Verrucomicrobiota bacterium]
MKALPVVLKKKIRLCDFPADADGGLDKDQTKEKTEILGVRLDDLQQLLYANSNRAVLLVFQGMDASGKDGCVRSLLKHVNPAGVQTTSFKVPSVEELAHDYLWRIHHAVPRYGHIGVFNRSHYESVLAERILKLVPKAVWTRRYQQIVDFEQMLVENNILLLKFYLHISKDEQAERLEERLTDPKKNWKFALSDLQTRKHWDDYMEAYEQMLNATSHSAAPWHLIPANRNWYRNFLVARTVTDALEKLKMKWPRPKEDLSKIKVV